MEIKIFQRGEIDDKRWNGCVHFALSAMPYAYTWYLDNVCEEWFGLVVGKYKMVMPIVLGKKWGVKYNYQPFFTQQLGVYSDLPISQETMDAFFKKLPKDLKYVEMSLNESNYPPKGVEAHERKNFLLDLKPNYEDIAEQYSGSIKRNIKKARKHNLQIHGQFSPEVFADFYKKNTTPKINGFQEKHYYMMLRLIYAAIHYNMGFLIGAFSEDGQMQAANFMINHPQRLINLMPTSSESARENGAMSFLIDHVIERNAGQNKHLDFEGSMLEGVAKFYRGFGAKAHPYYHVKLNLLPKILRIFKK